MVRGHTMHSSPTPGITILHAAPGAAVCTSKTLGPHTHTQKKIYKTLK